jgi:hypothetical protein
MPRRKKSEVKIESSFIPYLKEPEILEDTIEAERKNVFAVAQKAGKSLSGLMIAIGVMLSVLTIQYLANPFFNLPGFPTLGNLLTSEFIMFLAAFLGIINIICGFVLLAKE